MGTKIVIELDNDGMLEDMDIQNDYLSEEKIAQGFITSQTLNNNWQL